MLQRLNCVSNRCKKISIG